MPEALAGAPEAAKALLDHREGDADDEDTPTLFRYHADRFARRRTSDFFVHRDLEAFLARELEYYLRSEVLSFSSLAAGGEAQADAWLDKMRVIREVGRNIIEFLAQIEGFQKMLWEKRKFRRGCPLLRGRRAASGRATPRRPGMRVAVAGVGRARMRRRGRHPLRSRPRSMVGGVLPWGTVGEEPLRRTALTVRVIALVEGQTEEAFVRRLLAPMLSWMASRSPRRHTVGGEVTAVSRAGGRRKENSFAYCRKTRAAWSRRCSISMDCPVIGRDARRWRASHPERKRGPWNRPCNAGSRIR